MTVFKTFLKVLDKCKAPIIMYTVFLLFFGVFNMSTADNQINFAASKPDVLIINQDEEIGITKSLIEYIKDNSNIKEIEDEEDKVADALFYRDVNYIIYIPKGFRQDFLANKHPEIEVKSTGDYQASLAQMMLERYLKVAKLYQKTQTSEEELIRNIDKTLSKQVEVQMTSKLDTDSLNNSTFYYNFASYSLLAGCVYVICLVIFSFREEKIRKRTMVSSTNYKKINRQLLLSNSLFAVILWMIYVVLSFFMVENMFTMHGLIYILNSFIFTLCALAISFVIGNMVHNKNAINGIVNVIALGSSFLCGAFVPMEMLPDFVLKIAHILPSYWYIKTNEMLKTVEVFNIETLKPIFINMGIIIIFIIVFCFISSLLSSNKKRNR